MVLRGGEFSDPVHCVRKTLDESDMKGIGHAYETYVLFAPRVLNGSYKAAKISSENSMPAANLGATQNLLSADLVQHTADLYYQKPVEDITPA
jgi:hypothetical protein